MIKTSSGTLIACSLAAVTSVATVTESPAATLTCGQDYTVARGDTLSKLSLRAYDSLVYQPIYNANVDTIGTNPDRIYIGQVLTIPCLSAQGAILSVADAVGIEAADARDDAAIGDRLVFTFNKASAPPFIINSGIVDHYLAEIAEVTEGRVSFVDPEVMNRDHSQQFGLVTSGEVDATYVLNSHLAASHPLLQLPMMPMLGGSAEQTAVSLWRLHEKYLAETNYFPEAQLLGFISAPAAHIWRADSMPVTASEQIAGANQYHVPYFHGLDTRGPAVMRAEFSDWMTAHTAANNMPPAFFMAHGAALAVGLWSAEANVSVMEVDNGLYTPTFSVIMSNDAWERISEADRQAILAVSGEKLATRSASWDAFDNGFRSKMLADGLKFEKAGKPLLEDLWMSSLVDLRAWMDEAERLGVPGNEAVNFYLASLRSLEDRLIYRGEETFVDQHPIVNSGS